MGLEKFKRPIWAAGLQIEQPSTFTRSIRMSGSSAGLGLRTETLTGTSAAQTLNAHGVSFVTYGTSGKANAFIIPNPPYAGAVKFIFAQNNTTSVELDFNTATTAAVFWGTTFNSIQCAAASTGSPGGTPAGTMALGLVGVSTSQWAVLPGSTFNWDVVGSTGSTATP